MFLTSAFSVMELFFRDIIDFISNKQNEAFEKSKKK